MNYFDINHFYKHGFALVEEFETEKKYIHQEMKNINCVEKKNINLANNYLISTIKPQEIIISGSLYLIGKIRKLYI